MPSLFTGAERGISDAERRATSNARRRQRVNLRFMRRTTTAGEEEVSTL